MARYIDRDPLVAFLAEKIRETGSGTHFESGYRMGLQFAKSAVELADMPTADVAEVKRGRWVETRIWGGRNYKCSVCDFDFTVDLCMGRPMWHYCPNCGAKMDEVEE